MVCFLVLFPFCFVFVMVHVCLKSYENVNKLLGVVVNASPL